MKESIQKCQCKRSFYPHRFWIASLRYAREVFPMREQSMLLSPFTRPLSGQAVTLPGSKSITNRALLLAALSKGTTLLQGCLESEDTVLMRSALERLGVRITGKGDQILEVEGVDGQFPVREAKIEVGTAGTVARLLIGILGVQAQGCYAIDGSEVMRRRPMNGLCSVLEQAGCEIDYQGQAGALPFTLKPRGWQRHKLEVDASASSQVLSAVIMAAASASAPVEVTLSNPSVRKPYVVMTDRMMQSFGAPEVITDASFRTFTIPAFEGYRAPETAYQVESDASAASYFLALPLVTGGSLTLRAFAEGGLQGDVAFVEVLRAIGARTTVQQDGLNIQFPGSLLHPLHWNFHPISDTFLTLAAIAPLLPKPVRMEGIAHTRKQESDRVAAMATELRKLGQNVEEEEDSLTVFPDRNALLEVARAGVSIDTYRDHRIAMSFAILGCRNLLRDGSPWMEIRDPMCCEKTFPEFFETLGSLRSPEA
jgi:3-phosphoshikimate 1-carboxyvinyltransferase